MIKFEQRSDEKFIDATGLKYKKIKNGEYKLEGKIIFKQVFDDTYTAALLIYNSFTANGQYKLTAYGLPPTGFCKCIAIIVKNFVEISDFPNPAPCPFGNVS